jgi:Bacterial conjugation TrbI-like protein
MAKNQPVLCVVREGGSAEEDWLVEYTMRMPLHPFDQFRAFKALCDAGTGSRHRVYRFASCAVPIDAGLEDGVNYHWGSLAKAALILTVLGVGAELGSDSNDVLTRALRRGTQDTINQSGQQIVRRQLNVTPTLTIRPGFPVRVIVTKDLILAPIGDKR